MAVILLSGSARAWFVRKPLEAQAPEPAPASVPAQPDPVAAFSAPEAEAFEALLTWLQRRREESVHLRNLLDEKTHALRQTVETLEREFSICDEQSYRFDATNRVLYVLHAQPAEDADAPPSDTGATVRYARVRSFSSDEETRRFLAWVAQRQTGREQVAVLESLLQENRQEIEQLTDRLHARFGVDPTRQYHYNASSRRLFRAD